MLIQKIRSVLCITLFLTLPWQQVPLIRPTARKAVAQSKPIAQTVPQPLTLYQPLQNLQWEGEQISPTGIAYFPLEGIAHDSILESDLEVAISTHDTRRIATTLTGLGLSHHLQGEYDKAIAYYKQGLEIVKQSSDANLESTILGNLGLAHVQSGNYYVEAFDYLNEYANLVQDRRKIVALGNLANAYFGADLYAKAIALHQQRLILAQKAQDRTSIAKTLSDLGIVYQALGESAKAIQYQEQGLAAAQKIPAPLRESFALGNLGILYQNQRDYAKATKYQQQQLTLSSQLKDLRGEAESLANLGGIAYFQGNYQGAIALYEQAWNIAWNTLHDANILYRIRGNQGLVYAQMGDKDKALEAYGQYFRYASSRSNRREEGIAKINAAAVRFQSGDLPGAAKTLREAIATWESLRSRLGSNDSFKISLFETQNAPYSNLQSVLIAQNQPEAALEISERGRARVFAELLARRLTPTTPKISTQTPLAAPTIAQIKQIAKYRRATLVEYAIVPAQFEVQGKLETRESELLIWVVQPTGITTLRRVDLKPLWQCQLAPSCVPQELADLVSIRRTALSGTRSGKISPLQRLHKLLIQPIAELLPKDPNDLVVFIPHRSLLLVPFAALQDEQGKFLIEQHTIAIAPSIQVLELTSQLKKRLEMTKKLSMQSLIVGNPTMPKAISKVGLPAEQLPPLPGAETEAIEIARLLKSVALIGNAAKKADVLKLLSNSRIIHLATHGLMGDFSGLGLPGAIALAPDKVATGIPSVEENGLLTANEIFELQLNAELVVLSACDTGRGKITGDGVVGLSRALIAARVPSIVVSLWAVPDESTALLMTEFYDNLQRQPDKAQALRQAMLTTMKQNPAPLDWAAFLLIGEVN